jgi:flagellar basal body-associated protein FliL
MMLNSLILSALQLPDQVPESFAKYKVLAILIIILVILVFVLTYSVLIDCFWCGKKFQRASRTRVDKGIKHFCCMKCFIDYDNKVDLYKGRENHEKGEVKAHGKHGGVF